MGTAVFVACTTPAPQDDDDPSCGDGTADEGEECDGADFGDRSCAGEGFEAGELTCTSSCTVSAETCVVVDDDQDGLSNLAEAEAGTDPTNPDSDTDGIADGAEFQAGSDPLDMYSWPQGSGSWPNRLAIAKQDLAGEAIGWGLGDRLLNQPWTDQFQQRVELHQFYGYVVVLSVGATWCPPCRQAALTSQALWDEHRDQGVVFVEQLNDGQVQGVDATQADVDGWVGQYEMQFPVVWANVALFNAPSIPTFYIMDRDLIVRDIIAGNPGDAALGVAINAVVAGSE